MVSPPSVDNDIDLGNFVDTTQLSAPLTYVDAANGPLTFETLISYDAISSVSGGILVSKKVKDLI